MISLGPTCAFDFETSGTDPAYALQPWRVKQGKAWATSLAAALKDPGSDAVLTGGLAPTATDMRVWLQQAIKESRRIIGWNVVFDIQWLLAYGLEDLVFQAKWLDGMHIWRHFFIEPEYEATGPNKKSYGLKTAVEQFLPQHAGYEQAIDFHTKDPALLKKLHEYNIKDTIFTLRITQMLWNRLEHKQQRCALIESECLPMVAKANLDGMVVDTLQAHELQAHLVNVAQDKLTLLQPLGCTEKIVRSPKQLAKLLFEDWGLQPYKTSPAGAASTDKETLHELSFKSPLAKTIKEYREALNNKTKFADTILTSVDYNEEGRTHPNAIVFGTYSGRLTYSSSQGRNKDKVQTGFALHQTKRGKEYRGIIIPPEGFTLMEFDASGQEFRWMAIASGDPTMLELCLPGEDPHGFMGARVTNGDYRDLQMRLKSKDDAIKELAKDARQLGKVANLSLQYRTSARKLRSVARVQYGLPMEQPQADYIHKVYQQTYRGVPAYWNTQIQLTKRQGYVETYAGRRVQVRGDWSGRNGWSMASTSINYRIQGTGADQKYLALMCLKNELRHNDCYFAWDLHDGIYIYAPIAKKDVVRFRFKAILDHLPYKKAWGFEPPIELPFDCKMGGSWGHMAEMKDMG